MFITGCFVSTYFLVILVYEPLSCSMNHWYQTCIAARIKSRIKKWKKELCPFQVLSYSFQQVISVSTACPFVVEENNLHNCSVILADTGYISGLKYYLGN